MNLAIFLAITLLVIPGLITALWEDIRLKKRIKRIKYYVLFICRNFVRTIRSRGFVKHKAHRETNQYYNRYANRNCDSIKH